MSEKVVAMYGMTHFVRQPEAELKREINHVAEQRDESTRTETLADIVKKQYGGVSGIAFRCEKQHCSPSINIRVAQFERKPFAQVIIEDLFHSSLRAREYFRIWQRTSDNCLEEEIGSEIFLVCIELCEIHLLTGCVLPCYTISVTERYELPLSQQLPPKQDIG